MLSGSTDLLSFVFALTVGQEDGCPRIIQSKLFRTFTVETFNNGRYDGYVSSSKIPAGATLA